MDTIYSILINTKWSVSKLGDQNIRTFIGSLSKKLWTTTNSYLTQSKCSQFQLRWCDIAVTTNWSWRYRPTKSSALWWRSWKHCKPKQHLNCAASQEVSPVVIEPPQSLWPDLDKLILIRTKMAVWILSQLISNNKGSIAMLDQQELNVRSLKMHTLYLESWVRLSVKSERLWVQVMKRKCPTSGNELDTESERARFFEHVEKKIVGHGVR